MTDKPTPSAEYVSDCCGAPLAGDYDKNMAGRCSSCMEGCVVEKVLNDEYSSCCGSHVIKKEGTDIYLCGFCTRVCTLSFRPPTTKELVIAFEAEMIKCMREPEQYREKICRACNGMVRLVYSLEEILRMVEPAVHNAICTCKHTGEWCEECMQSPECEAIRKVLGSRKRDA